VRDQQGHHGCIHYGNTKLEKKFSGLEIHHVVHDNNVGADVLSRLGFD
jgi:hypothetical protein